MKVSHEKRLLSQIGEQLAKRRKDLNVSIKGLERETGVTSVTINNLEKGRLENCSIQTLSKLSKGLKLKLIISFV